MFSGFHMELKITSGGGPYKKHGGAGRKFWNKTLRGTKISFCGRGWKMFSPLIGTSSKTTHYLLYCRVFFGPTH